MKSPIVLLKIQSARLPNEWALPGLLNAFTSLGEFSFLYYIEIFSSYCCKNTMFHLYNIKYTEVVEIRLPNNLEIERQFCIAWAKGVEGRTKCNV